MDIPAGGDEQSEIERAQFTELFLATAHRVRAYAARHVERDEVEEVLAATFETAWRRRVLLDPDDPVPWLLVTARNLIANRRRRRSRGEVAHPDLELVAAATPSVDGPVLDRAVALAALATLTPTEREAVLLVAWDGLDHPAAALVAGCSVRAFTVRLHRARTRLGRALEPLPEPSRSSPTLQPIPTSHPVEDLA